MDAPLEWNIKRIYGFPAVDCQFLDVAVNDVAVVITPTDRFAMKLYHRGRTAPDVQWEVELLRHLADHGAPVARPVAGQGGDVHRLRFRGEHRVVVLYEWAPGEKPAPTVETYRLLGHATGQVHRAADTFHSTWPRQRYDATVLIDEQLDRMRAHLIAAGLDARAARLGDRVKAFVADADMDTGACHMDLTLDNVHRVGDLLTVFDFDSAGICWRAIEPHGVLLVSRNHFDHWLDGYRQVRAFSARDEAAVTAFTVIGEFRAVAWKLGVAESSRGAPLLTAADLPAIVDEWEHRVS